MIIVFPLLNVLKAKNLNLVAALPLDIIMFVLVGSSAPRRRGGRRIRNRRLGPGTLLSLALRSCYLIDGLAKNIIACFLPINYCTVAL